jgi:transposase
MQGVPAFDPKAKASIDLESFVAEDHFLRRIDRVLDLSFVRELTAARYADGQGRPSIDPEVFFRRQLVAYLNGITKDRPLCEEVRYNLAYRWFCRLSLSDDVPEHSSLTRIRDRLGEEMFEQVFRKIVRQCQEKGLVKKDCRVMTDATLIAADASLDSLVHVDPEQAKHETEAQQRCGTFDGRAPRKLSNQTHRSCTDPDATLAQKKGTPRQHLKYKVHPTIDADSRVILDMEVTTGARHDNQPYLKQLERVREYYQITIREAIADRGYGSADIIRTLQGQQATFLERASERMWKCEGLFAESKQNHCLARAKYRGRTKVQIQAYMIAIVQNLKRLLFPLYCWLLAHRWSYSTNTALALPSNQSHPQPTPKSKTYSHFFNRPRRFPGRSCLISFSCYHTRTNRHFARKPELNDTHA